MPDQIESKDVERIRVEGDLRLREMELEFKKEKWSREVARQSRWSLGSLGPGLAAVIAALVGGVIGAAITGYFNLALEEKKLRSNLILKTVESKDQAEVAKRLGFLVDTGLLEDTTGKIAEYVKNPERLPTGWDDSGWDTGGWDTDRWGRPTPPKRAIPPNAPQSP